MSCLILEKQFEHAFFKKLILNKITTEGVQFFKL
jgi:hypothetical protein